MAAPGGLWSPQLQHEVLLVIRAGKPAFVGSSSDPLELTPCIGR